MSGYLSKRMNMLRNINSVGNNKKKKAAASDDEDDGEEESDAAASGNTKRLYNADESIASSSDEDTIRPAAVKRQVSKDAIKHSSVAATGSRRANCLHLLDDLDNDDDDECTRKSNKNSKRSKPQKKTSSPPGKRRRAEITESSDDEEVDDNGQSEDDEDADDSVATSSMHAAKSHDSQQSEVNSNDDDGKAVPMDISGISETMNISDILGPASVEIVPSEQNDDKSNKRSASNSRRVSPRRRAAAARKLKNAYMCDDEDDDDDDDKIDDGNDDDEIEAETVSTKSNDNIQFIAHHKNSLEKSNLYADDDGIEELSTSISSQRPATKHATFIYATVTDKKNGGAEKKVDLKYEADPTKVLARTVAADIAQKISLNNDADEQQYEVVIHVLRDDLWHEVLPSTPFIEAANFITCTTRVKAPETTAESSTSSSQQKRHAGGGSSQGEGGGGSAKISLFVQDGVTREKTEVKIGRTEPLKVLKEKYCAEKGLGDFAQVRFELDGERINDTDTCESLDLDGGECIDVVPPRTAAAKSVATVADGPATATASSSASMLTIPANMLAAFAGRVAFTMHAVAQILAPGAAAAAQEPSFSNARTVHEQDVSAAMRLQELARLSQRRRGRRQTARAARGAARAAAAEGAAEEAASTTPPRRGGNSSRGRGNSGGRGGRGGGSSASARRRAAAARRSRGRRQWCFNGVPLARIAAQELAIERACERVDREVERESRRGRGRARGGARGGGGDS